MSWLSALLGSDDGREQPLAEVEREGIASLRRSMQELLADLGVGADPVAEGGTVDGDGLDVGQGGHGGPYVWKATPHQGGSMSAGAGAGAVTHLH